MKLKDILQLMRFYGVKPRKRLSQVFLVNERVLRKIAKLAKDVAQHSRNVLEIGCGPGILTIFLLEEGLEVVAIEIDPRFAPILHGISREAPFLHPVIADARQLLLLPSIPRVVVGNLPYHISSELLIAIARSVARKAVVTVQKEVAERIVAKPGSDSYGRLSVVMQLVFNARVAFVIPPKFFRPRPEVASATVVLERVRDFDDVVAKVEEVTRCLFSYKNKLALKALKACFPEVLSDVDEGDEMWKNARVRDLDPRAFLEIARICVEKNLC